MKITVDISMYPLDSNYIPPIKSFIHALRGYEGLEIVTNQLSTQIRGEFGDVMPALSECMRESMLGNRKVVFVTRFLNSDLDIGRLPQID
jgi:uncharacterized protein YqgV (UPF0045/DUF77 family)